MYLLLTGCLPFEGANDEEIKDKILNHLELDWKCPEIKNCSKEAKNLLKLLLQPIQNKRNYAV